LLEIMMVRNIVVLFVVVVAASLVLSLRFWRLLGLLQPILPNCFFDVVVLVLSGGVCSAVWFERLRLIVRRVLANFLGWNVFLCFTFWIGAFGMLLCY